MKWITASQLENWAQSETARAKLPALIAALVRASAKHIGTIRFPAEDKSQVHGFDGHLVAVGVPFVQDGESLWELGTSADYLAKANNPVPHQTDSI
jgi:hypothetical protein